MVVVGGVQNDSSEAKVKAGPRHFGIPLAVAILGNLSPNGSHRHRPWRVASVVKGVSLGEVFSWVEIMELEFFSRTRAWRVRSIYIYGGPLHSAAPFLIISN